jgi:hypothetical protein
MKTKSIAFGPYLIEASIADPTSTAWIPLFVQAATLQMRFWRSTKFTEQ